MKITKQGRSSWADTFDRRSDPAGREYFWLTGKMDVTDTDPETDQLAIQAGYISVTPVHYQLTDEVQREVMGGWELAVKFFFLMLWLTFSPEVRMLKSLQ